MKSNFDKEKDVQKRKSLEFDLPLVNAKNGDNGIMYYGRSKDFESAEMTIDIVNDGAVSTGNVYVQPQKTGVLYNAYLIKPNFIASENLLYFFTSAIRKSIKLKFGYDNKAGWTKVKEEKITLPIKGTEIDFYFMETFIAKLQSERISKLENYLLVTELKDYSLTVKEQEVLDNFEQAEFKEFKVTDIFDVNNSKSILSRDIVEDSGTTPYLCASADNNAVSTYIAYDKQHIDTGNCVFIGGKTFEVTYQEKDFYSNDSHNLILHLKNAERSKSNQLYLATCVKKGLAHKYSWGDSISNRKIQKDIISLPVKDDQPNYSIMDTLISAIQKLVIKDVVLYVNDKMQAQVLPNEPNKTLELF